MTETQPAGTRRRRLGAVLLLLLVGAVGGVATVVLLRDPRTARPAAGGEQSGTGTVLGGADPTASPDGTVAEDGVFFIEGRAAGLVPGRPATLALKVTNPNPWPIHVLTLDTGVSGPSGARCPAGTLTVARYAYADGPKYAAPARGAVEVPVRVELTDSATVDQTACAGATFPLTMTGTAVRSR